jgi:hypothetical protein
MTDEYTPTTEQVRNAFTFWRRAFIVRKSWYDESLLLEQTNAEFTRWLEAHDREVAEKAWDEACSAFAFLPPTHNDTDTAAYVASTNPHREGASELASHLRYARQRAAACSWRRKSLCVGTGFQRTHCGCSMTLQSV